MLADVRSIKTVTFPLHRHENGDLTVIEANHHFPLPIARVFTVRAAEGALRGQHAHRRCTQMLVCTSGAVEVTCDDGAAKASFVLDHPDVGLVLPPGLWAEQLYRAAGSILTVFCDRPYEADDYIRDYPAFIAYRKEHAR